MSLLDGGSVYEPIVVHLEETYTDEDGNLMTRASETGIPARARFQVQGQSGTSARRAEQDNEGFSTEKVYRMRFPRSFTRKHGLIGAQSKIVWNNQEWAVFGDVSFYSATRATQHVDYTVKRF